MHSLRSTGHAAWSNGEMGAAFLEASLVMFAFLTMVLGGVEFIHLSSKKIRIQTALNETARWASFGLTQEGEDPAELLERKFSVVAKKLGIYHGNFQILPRFRAH